jgi:hypothetical protein
MSGFGLFYSTKHVNSHDFVWLLLVACTGLLYNRIRTYGKLKAVCKSRTCVHLGKFPVVRRILHCNETSDGLAFSNFMCSLHVILLPKITPRYFTWLTKGLLRPFSVRWASGVLSLWEKQMAWVLALTSRLNSTETSLQLSENITVFAVCRIYTGVVSKGTPGVWDVSFTYVYIYIHTLYNWGDRTEPCDTLICVPRFKVKVEVTLRQAVYRQSIRVGAKTLKAYDQSIFLCNWTLAAIVLM